MKKQFSMLPEAREEFLSLPFVLQAALVTLIRVLEEDGRLASPHGELVDRTHRIFAIRTEDNKLQGRVFYVYCGESEIWGLHVFVKKSQKDTRESLELAKRRLKRLL
jgi:phage-related protein